MKLTKVNLEETIKKINVLINEKDIKEPKEVIDYIMREFDNLFR